jgi:hypothetical protein
MYPKDASLNQLLSRSICHETLVLASGFGYSEGFSFEYISTTTQDNSPDMKLANCAQEKNDYLVLCWINDLELLQNHGKTCLTW